MAINHSEYTKIWNLGHARASEVHELFQQSWWANSRNIEDTRKVLDGSDLTFGLLSSHEGLLVAFARVNTDYIFKATIFDVIVHQNYRGLHLGQTIINSLLDHPDIKKVEHVELYCNYGMLSFYQKFDFYPVRPPVHLVRKR